MVDSAARHNLSKALEEYLESNTTSAELDDTLTRVSDSSDQMCREIAKESWFFYDDFKRHRNDGRYRIDPDHEQIIRRWIAILQTKVELGDANYTSERKWYRHILNILFGETPRFIANSYWPLLCDREWQNIHSGGDQGTGPYKESH